MNAKDLKTDEVYALGRGDVRADIKEFRRVAFVRRVKPQYDEFNRTKQVNKGRVVVRMLDDPWDEPDPWKSRHRHNVWPKGEEIEIDPRASISWTWSELEAVAGDQLREEGEWAGKERTVTEFFAELGIDRKYLNLGRNSLHYAEAKVNLMLYGDLDDCKVQLPFKILRKLVAGTAITEEDWG